MAMFYAPLIAFTTTLFTVWWLARRGAFALDFPNDRSLHRSPLPRTGGLGLHAGVLLATFIVKPGLPGSLVAGWVVVVAVSFIDDLRGIAAVWRLIVHLGAAGILTGTVLYGEYGLITALVSAIAIAWMTNLYNFMDGADGLAGGMTLFGFTFYGIAAWLAGATQFTALNFCIAATAVAFLIFNFHPARIFMGDVGSVPLGFLAASLGLLGVLDGYWPWWFPMLIFSPFVVDASITLLRRTLRHDRIWEPHRDHYYQRLVQLGWGHRRTALAEYGAMAVCGGIGLLALMSSSKAQQMLLSAVAVTYMILIVWVEHAWRVRVRKAQ